MKPDEEVTQISAEDYDGRALVGDEGRLAALNELEILDTPGEESFDDIVAIASALCRTPIACVSLIGHDRQWLKAKLGLDIDEIPAGQSICACALGSKDLLIIPDLKLDPRTETNPMVAPDAGVRFYAGAPLATASGEVVGVLCVIDPQPRPEGLTAEQQSGLAALARQTVRLMEMRHIVHEREIELRVQYQQGLETRTRAARSERARRRLERYHRRQRAAQAAGRIGTFIVDIAQGEVQVSPETCEHFGLPEAESYPAPVIESLVVPEDREMRSSVNSRANGSATLDVEYRITRASDGAVRWISRRAAFERDEDGTVVRMAGTVQDVTDRRIANDRLTSLLALGDRLREAESPQEVEALLSASLGDVLDASQVGYANYDAAKREFTVTADWTDGRLPSARGVYDAEQLGATLALASRGEPVVVPDVAIEPHLVPNRDVYEKLGVAALILMPLFVGGVLAGVIFVHSTSVRAWSQHDVGFLKSVADRAHAALAQLHAEAEQAVLNAELSHRLKNTLAMAGSIAAQTLKGVPDREPVEVFQKRLIALSSAHDVLMQDRWTSARIRTVIDGALKAFAFADRVALSGPDLTLGPRAALAMALVIHELGTNAFKYGALSNDTGKVAIDWSVEADRCGMGAAEDMLRLTWRETGGPPVEEPSRKGFGSRLIATGLTGAGGVATHYRPEGFAAEFTAPLRSAQDG